jgi:hypothetical protein
MVAEAVVSRAAAAATGNPASLAGQAFELKQLEIIKVSVLESAMNIDYVMTDDGFVFHPFRQVHYYYDGEYHLEEEISEEEATAIWRLR